MNIIEQNFYVIMINKHKTLGFISNPRISKKHFFRSIYVHLIDVYTAYLEKIKK